MLDKTIVVLRGGGDIASGIAIRLQYSGFNVITIEIEKPSNIRRKVSFAEAVYEKDVLIQGIHGKLARNLDDALALMKNDVIPVLVDPKLNYFRKNKPYILVDSILAKKNLGTSLDMASIVIGIGPGFNAGIDVDSVIESKRGHYLGSVILRGETEPNSGIPGNVEGFTEERIIRALCEGEVQIIHDIGSIVKAGETIAIINGVNIKSKLNGVVRGMIRDGYYVNKGMKMGDIDPRSNINYCFSISDKARAIGGGVLEAILYFDKNKGINYVKPK